MPAEKKENNCNDILLKNTEGFPEMSAIIYSFKLIFEAMCGTAFDIFWLDSYKEHNIISNKLKKSCLIVVKFLNHLFWVTQMLSNSINAQLNHTAEEDYL